MTFLHPALFAAAAGAVAIPILIHLLLRQRRRPIMWGAMRFLLEAYRKQRKRLQLQQIILLAVRCLVVLLIGSAIARPLLSRAGIGGAGRGAKTVYLVVDNGLASSARTDEAQRTAVLDGLKARAAEVISSLGPSDRAGLVSLGAPANAVVVPASTDLAAVRNLLMELEPTDAPSDLAGALDAIGDRLRRDAETEGPGGPVVVAVFSEFRSGSADLSRPLPSTLAGLEEVSLVALAPASEGVGNIQVTGVEPLRPVVLTGGSTGGGATEQVRVTLRRTGDSVSEAGVSTVRLRVGGGEVLRERAAAQAAVRWAPGQADASVALQVDPAARDQAEGGLFGTVLAAEIDRDAVPSDNVFYRPVGVREALRVGVIARRAFLSTSVDQLSSAAWIRLALRPSFASPMDVVDIDPATIDVPTLASLDVAFLPSPDLVTDEGWLRLAQFVANGGLLVVTPAAEAPVHLWSDEMVRALDLPWRIAREARFEGEGGVGVSDEAPESALLELIKSEMPALARPVRVSRVLAPEEVGRSTDIVLRLADGTPWLIADEPGSGDAAGNGESAGAPARRGRGLVVYLASAPALSWTDLPARALMVPLVQELARQGFGEAAGSWSSPAGRLVSAPPRAVRLEPLTADARSETVTAAGMTAEPIRRAGLWEAKDEAGRGRGIVAVNADSDAGRTGVQDPGAVRSWLSAALRGADGAAAAGTVREAEWLEGAALTEAFSSGEQRSPWSLPLLVVGLVLAMVEVLLARWFSHAFVDRGAPRAVGVAS